jgi:hypothetical protein
MLRPGATMFDAYLDGRAESGVEDHRPVSSEDYLRCIDGKPRYTGVADFLASRGIESNHRWWLYRGLMTVDTGTCGTRGSSARRPDWHHHRP